MPYIVTADQVVYVTIYYGMCLLIVRVQRSSPRQHASFHPVLSPSFLYHPYIPSFKSKDFSFTKYYRILSDIYLHPKFLMHFIHFRSLKIDLVALTLVCKPSTGVAGLTCNYNNNFYFSLKIPLFDSRSLVL